MVEAQQHEISSGKELSRMDYLFLSGVLALDLVNTEIIVRGKRYDLLSTPEDGERWWREALAHYPDAEKVKGGMGSLVWSWSLLERLKQLRAAIRTLCGNRVEQQQFDQEVLTMLNSVLAKGYPKLEVVSGQKMVAVYATREPQQGSILLSLALSALNLFTQAEVHRLHKCKNERCILFFYDTTKSATRQWCSLECMNRARSLQHYQHLKAERSFASS